MKERGQIQNRRDYAELYRNAVRFFGSWQRAQRAALSETPSIHFKHRLKRPRESKNNLEIAREILRES